MIIGIPKEIINNENRVSIIPFGVEEITKSGHQVFVETNAGLGSGYSDKAYKSAGAIILNDPEEIFNKSDMIIKVKEPQKNEISMIREGQVIFAYFQNEHLQ